MELPSSQVVHTCALPAFDEWKCLLWGRSVCLQTTEQLRSVIITPTRSLWKLQTTTCSFHTWAKSNIKCTVKQEADERKSVACPVQMIWVFALTRTAPPGNEGPGDFRVAVHVWKELKGFNIPDHILHILPLIYCKIRKEGCMLLLKIRIRWLGRISFIRIIMNILILNCHRRDQTQEGHVNMVSHLLFILLTGGRYDLWTPYLKLLDSFCTNSTFTTKMHVKTSDSSVCWCLLSDRNRNVHIPHHAKQNANM